MSMSEEEKQKMARISLEAINKQINDANKEVEILHAAALDPDEHAMVCSSLMMTGDTCLKAIENAPTDHYRILAEKTFANVAKVFAKFMAHEGQEDPVEYMKETIERAKEFSVSSGGDNFSNTKH